MRALLAVLSLALGAQAGFAQTVVREIQWSALKEGERLEAGQVIAADAETPFDSLKVSNSQAGEATIEVLRVDDPGVAGQAYAIAGTVRCEDLQGTAEVHAWSIFSGGPSIDSIDREAWKHLKGSSDWHPFEMVVRSTGKSTAPKRLALTVVMTGPGTVYLGPVQLLQYPPGPEAFASAGDWWSEAATPLIAVGTGAVIGCLAVVIAALVLTGRGRRVVMPLLGGTIAAGAALIILGLVAMARSQPYAVSYPLSFIGMVCLMVSGLVLGPVRRRYEQLELLKMAAQDSK